MNDGFTSNTDAETENYLLTHFCHEPFETIETTPDGLAFLCCPAWLPVAVGDINATDAASVWLGPIARELRHSIIDGSYRYCSRLHCDRITNRTLADRGSKKVQKIIEQYELGRLGEAVPHPRHLILSHDRSCNLACPSCRTDFIVANKQQQRRLDVIMENTILPLLQEAETVKITGSGDPFGSNHFRRILQRINRHEFPNLKIDLLTNGQLFDEKAWNDLELEDLVNDVYISIDAATEDTYKVIRRGGDFGRLLKNLQFIKKLRQADQIRSLSFLMVVQTRNFAEMPDFVRLGFEYSADCISFAMIRNWGTFSEAEFKDEFIGGYLHPRHEEFSTILKHPLLSHPSVQMGNMLSYSGKA